MILWYISLQGDQGIAQYNSAPFDLLRWTVSSLTVQNGHNLFIMHGWGPILLVCCQTALSALLT